MVSAINMMTIVNNGVMRYAICMLMSIRMRDLNI